MQGERILFIGGQGPVSAPALRTLAPDNDVSVLARFSSAEGRARLESLGITCIVHDIFDPVDPLPIDFGYVYYTALPKGAPAPGTRMTTMSPRESWPDSYDTYADATGRLMAHLRPAKGFLFASSISVYEPPGGETPVAETATFGIHTTPSYAFTKVANEAVVTYLSRSLGIPTTIIRVGSASGVDGGPMHSRLDMIARGEPIPVHPDKPTYMRPIFELDAARLGVAALAAGRVPPLVVNWCGDDIVSVEDYCTFMGGLIGREPIFDYTAPAWKSLVPDTTFRRKVLGECEVRWQDGCRRLVEQCYPELLVSA